MSEVDVREQFVLRVKKHSEVDRVLTALVENGPMTEEQIQEAGGLSRSFLVVRWFNKWFDNIHSSTDFSKEGNPTSVRYTPVIPSQVHVVTSDVKFGSAEVGGLPAVQDHEDIRWPLAPPLIEEMENFDTPPWFELMKKMVSLGKHISIEGPPGTGKDTAVQQLAAQEGRVLVTIGGDAGFRRRDLVGQPVLRGGSSHFEVAEYVAAAVNGWWVLLTEVNAADADALMYINTQLAPPNIVTLHGKAYPVHPDFRLFITYNSGLIGTKPLPQSFKDRFFPVKVGFFSEYQLRRRMVAMGMPDYDKSDIDDINEAVNKMWPDAVVRFGLAMWEAHERGQMRYQVTTRRLADAVDIMMNGVNGGDVSSALKTAVLDAIDSPVERKAAESVLREVLNA